MYRCEHSYTDGCRNHHGRRAGVRCRHWATDSPLKVSVLQYARELDACAHPWYNYAAQKGKEVGVNAMCKSFLYHAC